MQRIYIAGHRRMVGSAIVRGLTARIACEIVTRPHTELNLTDQVAVQLFFLEEPIEQVYLAAAKVEGIHANNTYAAHLAGVQKLLFLGLSCVYPRNVPQPMREDAFLTGVLDPINEPYAIVKIAGINLCESYNRQYRRDYRSVMPTNLYGSEDNFYHDNSQGIPALMRRFHEAVRSRAEKVVNWGSGAPMREFLHVDDMAEACTIRELGETLARVTGFTGKPGSSSKLT